MTKSEARKKIWGWLLGELNGTAVEEVFSDIEEWSEADQDRLAAAWNEIEDQIVRKLNAKS